MPLNAPEHHHEIAVHGGRMPGHGGTGGGGGDLGPSVGGGVVHVDLVEYSPDLKEQV